MGMRKEEIRKGDYKMHRDIEERIKEEAKYFLSNSSTTRETAKAFGVSKSLIHKDLSKRLSIRNLLYPFPLYSSNIPTFTIIPLSLSSIICP